MMEYEFQGENATTVCYVLITKIFFYFFPSHYHDVLPVILTLVIALNKVYKEAHNIIPKRLNP